MEDQEGAEGGLGQEEEGLEGQGDPVDQEEDEEVPACRLCHASSRSCPPAGRD